MLINNLNNQLTKVFIATLKEFRYVSGSDAFLLTPKKYYISSSSFNYFTRRYSTKDKMADNSGYLPDPKGFSTTAIHAGQDPDQWDSMCVVPPIVLSTTFKQYGPANFKKYEYGRSGNPSRDVLESSLAALEKAKHAVCFASGLGSLTALMSVLSNGDHIICCDDMYGGNFRLLDKVGKKFGIESTAVDTTNLANVKNAIKTNTKMIFLESPTNPLLKVTDIAGVAEIAKNNKLLLAVDNTFLTPYLQRPLDLGADISTYSLTKYMNGHSDVIMGAVVTNNTELAQQLRFLQNAMGIIPGPFDCALVTRSLKTLALRMQKHRSNALEIANFLNSHPKVLKVMHPSLPSHPQHELAKRQTSGHSGVFSFYIDGDLKASETFLKSIKVFTLAESLGGYESLAELPAIMTHASIPADIRKELGITDNFIRISVGLEDVEDLIADLKQAFEAI